MAKKDSAARRLAGMTVGKQKPKAAPGMGDVKEAEHRRVTGEREEARRARERRKLLEKKGRELA